MPAEMRARRVLRQLGLDDTPRMERVPSAINEAWFVDGYVLRVTSSPASKRLQYEVDVVRSLPEQVRYPEIVAYGTSDFAEFLLTRRVAGEPLSRAWSDMDDGSRREAIHQLAAQLELIHRSPGPLGALGPLPAPFESANTLECPHQLPVPRLISLLERASRLPNIDASLLLKARDLVIEVGDALDDWPSPHLVHGDAHLENVLWDGECVSAILDFEFSRRAPADLDLDILLRFCADPGLHVAAGYERSVARSQYRQVPSWLRESYPALFSHPRLADRLTIYGLAYDVRQLLADPPRLRPADLPPHHPINRIRRVIERRTHLQWMEL